MSDEERDKIIDEYKQDKIIYDKVADKPHYVFISAVLLDGKIWKWNIGLTERNSPFNEFMKIPKELAYQNYDEYEYKEKKYEFGRRFTMLSFPIWVTNMEEHNKAFEKGIQIYKQFPIHEKYCNGIKPYEE